MCLLDTISKIPPGETGKPCYTAQQENHGNPRGILACLRSGLGFLKKSIGSRMSSIKAVAVLRGAQRCEEEEEPKLKQCCNTLKEKDFSLNYRYVTGPHSQGFHIN